MKIRKSLPTTHFPFPDSKGQTIIEFVLIFFISLVLIFGVMDIARLSWTMFHLHGAAFAAARSASVNLSGIRGPSAAANWVTKQTLGSICAVRVKTTGTIPTEKDTAACYSSLQLTGYKIAGWKPLKKTDLAIKPVKAEVDFLYKPLFAYGAFKRGIPLRVTCRTFTEVPKTLPPY